MIRNGGELSYFTLLKENQKFFYSIVSNFPKAFWVSLHSGSPQNCSHFFVCIWVCILIKAWNANILNPRLAFCEWKGRNPFLSHVSDRLTFIFTFFLLRGDFSSVKNKRFCLMDEASRIANPKDTLIDHWFDFYYSQVVVGR